MAPNKGVTASKAAAKAAKKSKQNEKAAKKEGQAIRSKGKGKLEDEEEDLEAILERYQQELQAVRLLEDRSMGVPKLESNKTTI